MRSKVRSFLQIVLSFLLTGSIWSCQEDLVIVHRSCTVESRGWESDAIAAFGVSDLAREGKYLFSVEARLDKSYSYKDLWVVVESRLNGERQSVDTVCMNVVNEKGEMTGTGRNLLEYSERVRTLEATPMDSLDFIIRHTMSDSTIAGVHNVSIRLVPIE